MFGEFGENLFGDFLAIMRRRFGEIVRRFWRKRFGDNVGDLEEHGRRSYSDFILEFVMK